MASISPFAMTRPLRMLDVFAGIGGFSLAGHWAGWETAAFIEKDEHCQRVLQKNFPGTPIYGDIKDFNYEKEKDKIGSIDIICGGFPCQPFSVAGNRKGMADDRYLWPEMLRLTRTFKPAYVVGENVIGAKMALDVFCSDLEGIGYSVQTFDISADSCNLPTLERHLWIVAQATGIRREKRKQKQVSKLREMQGQLPGGYQGEIRGWGLSDTGICGVRQRVSHRLDRSGRERLKQLGNAIVPQVAYQIFNAINQIRQ